MRLRPPVRGRVLGLAPRQGVCRVPLGTSRLPSPALFSLQRAIVTAIQIFRSNSSPAQTSRRTAAVEKRTMPRYICKKCRLEKAEEGKEPNANGPRCDGCRERMALDWSWKYSQERDAEKEF